MNLEDSGRVWALDNNIIGDGSIYSPDVCVFVPAVINNFNTKKSKDTITGIRGIVFQDNLYYAKTKMFGKDFYGGSFRNIEDAILRYQDIRIEYLMLLSEKYFKFIDDRILPKMLLDLTNDFI